MEFATRLKEMQKQITNTRKIMTLKNCQNL